MARTRVLLIEDNRLLREGIAAMLDGHGDFEVVAVSDDGDAVQALKESGKSPDVVLLDLARDRGVRDYGGLVRLMNGRAPRRPTVREDPQSL